MDKEYANALCGDCKRGMTYLFCPGPPTARPTTPSTTTSRPPPSWATRSTPSARCSFASGPRVSSRNSPPRASRWTTSASSAAAPSRILDHFSADELRDVIRLCAGLTGEWRSAQTGTESYRVDTHLLSPLRSAPRCWMKVARRARVRRHHRRSRRAGAASRLARCARSPRESTPRWACG